MTVATWLSKVKTIGFDMVLPIPMLSRAVISAFKTPEPVLLKIPIPLVAPVAGKFAILSLAVPRAEEAPTSVPAALPLLDPATPPVTFPALL